MELPSEDAVWEQVRAFAQACAQDKVPVYTLEKAVRNFITDVRPNSIGRHSDEGRAKGAHSRINRQHVLDCWATLQGEDPVGSGTYPYFTSALVYRALPDLLRSDEGVLVLRDPQLRAEYQYRQDIATKLAARDYSTAELSVLGIRPAQMGHGIFQDKKRTGHLATHGVTVSVLDNVLLGCVRRRWRDLSLPSDRPPRPAF